MGTSQRDSLPGGSRVGKAIEGEIGDGGGNGGGDGNGESSKGKGIRYEHCLLDGLRGLFQDKYIDILEKIVARCLTEAYESVSGEQEKQKSRGAIIKILGKRLKEYVREGCEDQLADLLERCLGKKIEADSLVPGEGCERILFTLYQEGLLIPALVEDAALTYLFELERLHSLLLDSDDIGATLFSEFGIEDLEDELWLHIVEKFNSKLIPLHRHGTYQESALKAANQSIESLLGEPASLPFASAEDIKDFLNHKTLMDVFQTFYAKYLCFILDYHFTQVAPKHLKPQDAFAWLENSQGTGGHCDKVCAEKASILIKTLDEVCEQETGSKIQALDVLKAEQIRLFFELGEERIREALFPGSKRACQLEREAANG